MPGFPNLFIMLGPNTGLGHSSMVYMIESQLAYVMDALRELRARGASVVEVRPRGRGALQRRRPEADAGDRLVDRLPSWYLDAQGNNPTLWPDWTWRFRQRTASFDPRST